MRKIGRHMNAWRGMNLKKNINTGIEHQIGKHSKKILLVVYNSVIYGELSYLVQIVHHHTREFDIDAETFLYYFHI